MDLFDRKSYIKLKKAKLVMGETWFGLEVYILFRGSVGSSFGFGGQTRGSVVLVLSSLKQFEVH